MDSLWTGFSVYLALGKDLTPRHRMGIQCLKWAIHFSQTTQIHHKQDSRFCCYSSQLWFRKFPFCSLSFYFSFWKWNSWSLYLEKVDLNHRHFSTRRSQLPHFSGDRNEAPYNHIIYETDLINEYWRTKRDPF